MRLYINFMTDYYGGRTYSSVYSPAIKKAIVEIVNDFNNWLHAYRDNPYTHTLLGRIMARRALRTIREYDQILWRVNDLSSFAVYSFKMKFSSFLPRRSMIYC